MNNMIDFLLLIAKSTSCTSTSFVYWLSVTCLYTLGVYIWERAILSRLTLFFLLFKIQIAWIT